MKVSVGQTIKERAPPYRLWEIVHIIVPQHGVRHARLRLAADHRKTMILSCATLENEDSYLAAGSETAA